MFLGGDVIGCGVDFSVRRMFYTKNGAFLGELAHRCITISKSLNYFLLLGLVFDSVGVNCDLFPSVGMRSPHESVRANFGQDPFKFDIDLYVRQERSRVWKSIQSTPIFITHDNAAGTKGVAIRGDLPRLSPLNNEPPAETSKEVMTSINELVLDYLTHNGYANTSRALRKEYDSRTTDAIAMHHPSTSDDMELDTDAASGPALINSIMSQGREEESDARLRIIRAVKCGDVDTALNSTRDHFPGVLDAEDGLMNFKLRCRKFVELILQSAELLRNAQAGVMNYTNDDDGAVPHHHPRRVDAEDVSIPDGVFEMDMDAEVITHPLIKPALNGHDSRVKGKMPRVVTPLPRGGAEYQAALAEALAYGRTLQTIYQDEERPEMQTLFSRIFGLVAYEDPLNAGGEPALLAGQEARNTLAAELNSAILGASKSMLKLQEITDRFRLASRGELTEPALERLYRQTSACIRELGVMGVGAAAFADIRREFLD